MKLANIKMFNNIQCGQECGEIGHLTPCWYGFQLVQTLQAETREYVSNFKCTYSLTQQLYF